jgi:hypothetical protein
VVAGNPLCDLFIKLRNGKLKFTVNAAWYLLVKVSDLLGCLTLTTMTRFSRMYAREPRCALMQTMR